MKTPLLLLSCTLLLSAVERGNAQNSLSPYGPKVFFPTSKNPINPKDYQHKLYPWHKNIPATIFWIGEQPTPNNPTPNTASSWDTKWAYNYGGYDNPDRTQRNGLLPRAFTPKQNPFYIALPYNDVLNHRSTKPEAFKVIPWFKRSYTKAGRTVCKGRWVEINFRGKSCYAQWEDCGPWTTDDWRYVFCPKGTTRPATKQNGGAGIDLSPAIRDYLKLKSGDKVNWRFIEFAQVPKAGPWTSLGTNNPFVNQGADPDKAARLKYFKHLEEQRDKAYRKRK